jgi:hypothetical protein
MSSEAFVQSNQPISTSRGTRARNDPMMCCLVLLWSEFQKMSNQDEQDKIHGVD